MPAGVVLADEKVASPWTEHESNENSKTRTTARKAIIASVRASASTYVRVVFREVLVPLKQPSLAHGVMDCVRSVRMPGESGHMVYDPPWSPRFDTAIRSNGLDDLVFKSRTRSRGRALSPLNHCSSRRPIRARVSE